MHCRPLSSMVTEQIRIGDLINNYRECIGIRITNHFLINTKNLNRCVLSSYSERTTVTHFPQPGDVLLLRNHFISIGSLQVLQLSLLALPDRSASHRWTLCRRLELPQISHTASSVTGFA